MGWVYKLTFPNGKIYVGKDLTGTFRYFGSWNSELVLDDFSDSDRLDFTVRREILFESDDNNKINKKEIDFIRKFDSNNPSVGYNQWPKWNFEK